CFFFSSRRRHTRSKRDWSSDVCSSDLGRRRFIILGLIGLIPATLLQGIVVAPWQMIIARLFQGLSAAMVFAPALALAGDIAKEEIGRASCRERARVGGVGG